MAARNGERIRCNHLQKDSKQGKSLHASLRRSSGEHVDQAVSYVQRMMMLAHTTLLEHHISHRLFFPRRNLFFEIVSESFLAPLLNLLSCVLWVAISVMCVRFLHPKCTSRNSTHTCLEPTGSRISTEVFFPEINPVPVKVA